MQLTRNVVAFKSFSRLRKFHTYRSRYVYRTFEGILTFDRFFSRAVENLLSHDLSLFFLFLSKDKRVRSFDGF